MIYDLFQQCDKHFLYPGQLKSHMTLHTGETPYSCDLCDKSFRLKKSLLLHSHSHTGEKPEKCKYCDKKYIHPNILNDHINKIHKNEVLKELESGKL